MQALTHNFKQADQGTGCHFSNWVKRAPPSPDFVEKHEIRGEIQQKGLIPIIIYPKTTRNPFKFLLK